MRLYSRKYHRYVEREVHFGVGKSVKTACGLVLFSRHVMVSIHSDSDGAVITNDINRVTCQRCLAARETRLRKIIAIENIVPGIFNRDSLCGEEWLINHGFAISKGAIDDQKLELDINGKTITLSNKIKPKDRKEILRSWLRGEIK